MDDRWHDTGEWVGRGIRREVFFFESGGAQLYGSLYAATSPGGPAVALCNSWGYEGNQSDPTIHRIALTVARAGGTGLLFHYPGFGDSYGELAEASLETLVDAAVGAVEEGRRRSPEASWALAGLMFGASVTTLAARRAAVDRLLLVQPVSRHSAYFSRLERSARRAAIRVPARAGNAYGYPLPRRILDSAAGIDEAVAAALTDYEGTGAIVRYEEPATGQPAPDRFEELVLPGTWRFGARQRPELAETAGGWLSRAATEAGE
jgi:hypothetical protein